MPLSAGALTTLNTVNSELGYQTGDDAVRDQRIIRYINVASDLFTRATNRQWYYKPSHEESIISFDHPILKVTEHLPLKSVTSITFEGNVVDSDDYEIHSDETGEIRHKSGLWSNTGLWVSEINTYPVSGSKEKAYDIVYEGGYITPKQASDGVGTRDLPYDVEEAVIQMAAFRDLRQGVDGSVKSHSTGQWSITYVDGVEVPEMFEVAVSRYRQRAMA